MRPALTRYYYYGRGGGLPEQEDALFHSTFVVEQDGANYYFNDTTGNNRRFLITDKDFPSDWTVGFPYKSQATISAPVGDAVLIAADINNYLYAGDGTPNQIPVVSLFQDVDYEHKLFTRHVARVVNAVNVETIQPRVAEIVLYNTVKTDTALTQCQSYFDVPTEQVDSVWLSPLGDDTTGTGTKANPYRSIDKIKATTAAYVYLKTGTYDVSGSSVIFTGASLVVQGVGSVSYALAATVNVTTQRPIVYNNIVINGNNDTYSNTFNQTIEYNSCKITKTNGLAFLTSNSGATDATFRHCILDTSFGSGLLFSNVTLRHFKILGCVGSTKYHMSSTRKSTSLELSYNRITGNFGSSGHSSLITVFNNTVSEGILELRATNGTTVKYNNLTPVDGGRALVIVADTDAACTGVQVSNNTIIGNTTAFLVRMLSDTGQNGYSLAQFWDNTITNTSVAAISLTEWNVYLYGNFDVRGNTLTGADLYVRGTNNAYVADNYVDGSAFINTVQKRAFVMAGTIDSNVTGVIIENNTLIGAVDSYSLVNVGSDDETNQNTINGAKLWNNKIVNEFATAGSNLGHSLFIHGGVDYSVKWNDITFSNGHAIVVKAGGATYTTTDGHISYNIFKCSNTASEIVWNRGAQNVIVANNTVVDFQGTRCWAIDDNTPSGFANSMKIINNVVSLSGNVGDCYALLTENLTINDNYYNKNGFAFTGTQEDAADFITAVSLGATGIPASRINGGEVMAGSNVTGLATNTVIPSSPTYNDQDATWQVGAFILD